MNRNVRGFVMGTLMLSLTQALISSRPATGTIGSALDLAGRAMRRASDPTIPLVPDLREQPAPAAPAHPSVAPTGTRGRPLPRRRLPAADTLST